MGESKFRGEAMQVRTPGGLIEVRWDKRGKATAMGNLHSLPSISKPQVCLKAV